MSRAYSLDLRERVVAAIRVGLSSYEARERYQMSESSARRWFNCAQAQGSPAALPVGGRRSFSLADKLDWITRRLAETPDLSLRGLLAELRAAGVDVSYFGCEYASNWAPARVLLQGVDLKAKILFRWGSRSAPIGTPPLEADFRW
jgi:transposase